MELTKIWHDEKNFFSVPVYGYNIQDRNCSVSSIRTHLGRGQMQGDANLVALGKDALEHNFGSIVNSSGIQHICLLETQIYECQLSLTHAIIWM